MDLTEISKDIEMEIIARVVEIGIRALFENFTYKFGGDLYHQEEGGPIGIRATCSASELCMQEWAESYLEILEGSDMWVGLLAG